MNARQVLDKIVKTLSLSKEEVLFTYAKLADGTIVESPTFDVGEAVEVVTEDGKTPAPDGEHELSLKDSEGNEVLIKVMTKDGIITERENVELGDDKEVKMESIAGGDMGDDEEVATEETAEPIDEDMKKHNDMKKVMEDMSYRIEELEKKMQSMMEVKEEGGDAEKVKTEDLPGDPTKVNTVEKMAAVEPDEDEEEELPKLDGAPIDENAPNKTGIKMNKKGSMVDPQNSFLSKLYK
jgi:hypothetical protein